MGKGNKKAVETSQSAPLFNSWDRLGGKEQGRKERQEGGKKGGRARKAKKKTLHSEYLPSTQLSTGWLLRKSS